MSAMSRDDELILRLDAAEDIARRRRVEGLAGCVLSTPAGSVAPPLRCGAASSTCSEADPPLSPGSQHPVLSPAERRVGLSMSPPGVASPPRARAPPRTAQIVARLTDAERGCPAASPPREWGPPPTDEVPSVLSLALGPGRRSLVWPPPPPPAPSDAASTQRQLPFPAPIRAAGRWHVEAVPDGEELWRYSIDLSPGATHASIVGSKRLGGPDPATDGPPEEAKVEGLWHGLSAELRITWRPDAESSLYLCPLDACGEPYDDPDLVEDATRPIRLRGTFLNHYDGSGGAVGCVLTDR
eukprot:TRINITY_DN35601_c0_g1_i1.p1 TRINITY_DN35601_c0_g1~~TRINITY_DN35601_c0_g1_i1.p1  ORF type:complete len:313 (+),score=102.10 TRINITY_DN35601_c0_g1_i1:48-941(+)